MAGTMKTLPETDDQTLCTVSTGLVEAEDFISAFANPFRERIAKNGFCNAYVVFDSNFQGWTEEAADLSFKLIASSAPYIRKVAYVNAPDSRRLLMLMMQPLSNGEVRYYEPGQEADALKWVKQTKEGDK